MGEDNIMIDLSKLFTRQPTRSFGAMMPAFLWQERDGILVKTNELRKCGKFATSHTVEELASKFDTPVLFDRHGSKFISLWRAQSDCFGRRRIVGVDDYLSRIFMLMDIFCSEEHKPIPYWFTNITVQATLEPIKRERWGVSK